MAKWIKRDSTDEYFNVDATLSIVPKPGDPPYLLVTSPDGKQAKIKGVDAGAIIAHLKTQGCEIDLERFRTKPNRSKGAKVVVQR